MTSVKRNPFKPSAGHLPPLLVGRDDILDDFTTALDDGPGAPGRLMRITGARGVGKTVILTEFRDLASKRGWEVIKETASPGMANRLLTKLSPHRGNVGFTLNPSVNVANIAGASLGEIRYERAKQLPLTLFEALSARLDELERKHVGLLLEIDEAQAADRDDMIAVATAAQELNTWNRDYALVFAGLPSMSSKWLNDDVITFMRRAEPQPLADVPLAAVAEALEDTFADTGMLLTGEPLHRATEATAGYPFMIQLVGYHVWRAAHRAHPSDAAVTMDDVEQGVAKAHSRLGDAVHEPELDGLSPIDKTYLLAMAQDDGPSSTSVIAERMGRDVGYASRYRARLLDAQVIRESGYGMVDFTIPYLREYLREHAAFLQMKEQR